MEVLNLATLEKQLEILTKSNTLSTQTAVNTVSTNLGSNADASSAVGSVHAKLKDIKAVLGGGSTSVIKSVQRGIISHVSLNYNATFDITISSVTLAKSFISLALVCDKPSVNVRLVSPTIIRVSNHLLSMSTTYSLSWEVVEYV